MMKLRFLIPVFAFLFILSCGDDPISPDEFNDEDHQAIENDENVPHDDENSESGNDSDGNTDTTHDDADSTNDSGDSQSGNDADNADSNDDTSDFQPDNDSDDTDSADDSDNNVPDNNDTTGDDDADSSDPTNDPDEQEDQDNPTADEDGITDNDGGENDADQDSGEEPDDDEYDFEVVLPYNGGSIDKTIDFGTEIKKIDVLLMVDLSGFITAAHDNLKANVKTALIDRIREKISDSAFGLVTFGTIEQKNQYNLAQAITTDTNKVRNAADTIEKVTSGSSTYHALALWEAATGEENHEQIAFSNSIGDTDYSRSFTIPAVDCSGQEGNIGGACFRENAMPVFVMASAKAFLDLTKTYSWTNGGNKMKTKPIAVEAMNSINAKFIGFSLEGTSSSTKPTSDFKYIAEQTSSQTLSNDIFNVTINADDSALSYQIAEAVKNLADSIKLSVKAEFKHVDNEYSVTDTTSFVKSFYPTAEQTVKAGSAASFDITFENKIHENNDCEPHIFYLTVEAAGEGLVLDSRNIKVVVPGRDCTESLK